MLQMQAYVAKRIAITSSAQAADTEGRHREVLGIFSGAEYKELKKIGLPAMEALSKCIEMLNTFFIAEVFKPYWRLRFRYQKEQNQRKIIELERQLTEYEISYAHFESAHDKALMHIDAIYNQFATRESILGANPDEDDRKGLSWVATGLGALTKKRTAQSMAKSEHPLLDRKSMFRFPTFVQAKEFARFEVEEKAIEAPQAKQKTVAKKKKQKPPSKRQKEVSPKTSAPITPALQGSRTLST